MRCFLSVDIVQTNTYDQPNMLEVLHIYLRLYNKERVCFIMIIFFQAGSTCWGR